MVDFNAMRNAKKTKLPNDPQEIFRRLPKPPQINDLYTSQAEVLQDWYSNRNDRDVVVKLHTGGGKTLVGLLMAQSTLNELKEPVIFLAPTNQLVNQTLLKAQEYGIKACGYESGSPLNDEFINGKSVLVASYKALFHGKSKFGLVGSNSAVRVGAVILDDAHVSFSVLRDSFTLDIAKSGDSEELYHDLAGLFRQAFSENSQIGTFDDVVGGNERSVLEVPFHAWLENLAVVREKLRPTEGGNRFVWPLVRDNLHLCHAFVGRRSFTITPILPFVDMFPTFHDAPRRIYMSATIADDSELVRTFGAAKAAVHQPLCSRSLAGVSERMILTPQLMEYGPDVAQVTREVSEWTTRNQGLGVVILSPSNKLAQEWSDIATIAKGSAEVDDLVTKLQARQINGPVVFANRYDGIDLPGESCRLLILDGQPQGSSNYELYRASALQGGSSLARMLAQRIEQGMGRAARGSGDYCVVLLVGADLAAWIAKESNFQYLTAPTRAQLEIGSDISKRIGTNEEFRETVSFSYDRNSDWKNFHAESLAEMVEAAEAHPLPIELASKERKAIDLWRDGYHEKAIAKLLDAIGEIGDSDRPLKGWLFQICARIAYHWGNQQLSDDYQQHAFGLNRILQKPAIRPPYQAINPPSSQAEALASLVGQYRFRRGLENDFDSVVAKLAPTSSASQFEQSLADLGQLIGFSTERFDEGGKGPDLIWLLSPSKGLVIEAKSRKLIDNHFTKDEHGQLLVAEKWFNRNYPNMTCLCVSVHPNHLSTEAAEATTSYVLTYAKLQELVVEARGIIRALSRCLLEGEALKNECERLLYTSKIRYDQIAEHFLSPFEVVLPEEKTKE
ncbi:DEAD/DEAH box helicase [Marinobacter sp. NFXS9]|uniref:DEAD/DEAH box helicase n=1 Tax=Marinobacter sp. NFXS9 TaxID=2818433 RepID=UPI0032DFF2AB